MDIVRITIKGESCYGPVDEAFSDKITITNSSIKYEYKPHPSSKLETNIPRKWSYTTDSPMFKELFITDIGATEIIATFEDKHRESAKFFCPSEFFKEYFRLIKEMVPNTEYVPAVLLTEDDYEEE